ncbi:hypothetical protein NQ315_007266 [Exocentrus adspersus]|uniref:RING-type E3 ubiquitin transferase n=1 Tax=Exocentrus adspersus TaxID=1586481 RepID=A0AAV8WD44_9CUCU|nr:hypothetical protein NQ315_007266 [Exocentrus adspersus]
MSILAEILQRKCYLCGYHLSVPPITLVSLDSQTYKCGRCAAVNCEVNTRICIYEDVAQHLEFPCSYTGCNKKIGWGQMLEHEKNCRYRTLRCPVYYQDCSMVVPVNQLKEHFEDKHSEDIKMAGDVWNLDDRVNCINLVESDNEYFFLYIWHLDYDIFIALLSIGRRSASTKTCPVYYQDCSMVVPVNQLKEHFEDKHSEDIKMAGDVWNLDDRVNCINLVESDNEYFFLYIWHLDYDIFIALLSIGRSKCDKFKIKFLPPNDDKCSVSLKDLSVIRYDERSHCFPCLKNSCIQPHHPFSRIYETTDMDMSNFLSRLSSRLVDCVKDSEGDYRFRMKLIPDPGFVDEPPADGNVTSGDVAVENTCAAEILPYHTNIECVKKLLTCPICMVYMEAPIFICPTGHTLCNVCKPQLTECPSCKATLEERRNYLVEEMAMEMKLPCRNDVKGCTFWGITSTMDDHEGQCSYQ